MGDGKLIIISMTVSGINVLKVTRAGAESAVCDWLVCCRHYAFVCNTGAERRGRQVSARGQLDDVPEGSTELLAERRLSVLLRRTAEHSLRPPASARLRRLHYTRVSVTHCASRCRF